MGVVTSAMPTTEVVTCWPYIYIIQCPVCRFSTACWLLLPTKPCGTERMQRFKRWVQINHTLRKINICIWGVWRHKIPHSLTHTWTLQKDLYFRYKKYVKWLKITCKPWWRQKWQVQTYSEVGKPYKGTIIRSQWGQGWAYMAAEAWGCKRQVPPSSTHGRYNGSQETPWSVE